MPEYADACNKECEFEVSPFEKLTGGIRATLYEQGQKGPQEIVSVDNDWFIKVQWYLKGGLQRHICGKFCVAVHFESIGDGEEFSFGPVTVDMEPCGDGRYEYVFQGSDWKKIKPKHCGILYKVGVTLTSIACDEPGHIAGFCDIGTVMFTRSAHAGN